MYKVGDSVKLKTSNKIWLLHKWNDLIGIIDEICDDVIFVLCKNAPYRYIVEKDNINDIELCEKDEYFSD